MDIQELSILFQGTMDPTLRADAEKKLQEISCYPGFTTVLLQLVMAQEITLPVRQAAVIYLKNLIAQHWRERDPKYFAEGQIPFVVSEQDKMTIKENIIEAVMHASELVRVQLTVCISEILSTDFPENWQSIVPKVNAYLTSENQDTWLGALLVLYQIVKKYEYKHKQEKGQFLQLMQVFLPVLHNRCLSVMKDDSAAASLIQAKILKIFRALIQLNLHPELINKNNFPQWLGVFKTVLERPIPEASLQWDEDDRPSLSWWKCKKWAIVVLYKIFERYGTPGQVEKEYEEFADFYDKHFAEQVMQTMLKILDGYRQKQYITPRVLQQALNYISQGVENARSWKVMKPHTQPIVREIIFPLMCHTEEDESLWQDDPHEFIKIKYDIFEDFLFLSPNAAAKNLLAKIVKKRKGVLEPTVTFIMEVVNTAEDKLDPKHKDGALHMMGTLATTLSKKKTYKNHMEGVLVQSVFPAFHSPHGFLRARACWVVQQFAIIQFKDHNVLGQTVNHVMNCLGNDKDLPVQVEAGIAVKHIMDHQDDAYDVLQPHAKVLALKLLQLLRETEADDLSGTIAKLVEDFPDEVASIALELTSTLCKTFLELIESEDDYESKSVTAMGVIETISCIVSELDEKKEIMTQLEQIVSELIVTVLQKEYMEFYGDIFSLLNDCTTVQISPRMWELLDLIYETFQRDTIDYFTEMMPCLYNYVTVDPPAFLSNPKHLDIMYNMAKKIVLDYDGEDSQCQAAKLLEVMILQYRGEMDQWLPMLIMVPLERLTKQIKTSELRVMCIQVVVAALFTNAQLTMTQLEKTQFSAAVEPVTAQLLSQWLKDTDCFLGLHDRKAYVLGLCSLLLLPSQARPQVVNILSGQFLPALILIFQGLKIIYDKMTEDDEDDAEEGDGEGGELSSDEDQYDEEGLQYVESLKKRAEKKIDDEFPLLDGDADLEVFTTPIDDNPYIDEYITFKNTLQALQANDPQLYQIMTQNLTSEHREEIQEILNEAQRKQTALESKQIEEQGGYKFTLTDVPTTFNFGKS